MKSKKMKQALALLCAGAMTVTGMNLPANVMSTDAAAKLAKNVKMDVEKTETKESGNDSIVIVNGMKEIDSTILAANAKANSEQIPAGYVNDGEAAWAFDDLDHWWHSRYQNTPQAGEVASGSPSAQNPIWIQTGFGESKKITKVTYQSRSNRHGIINKYVLQIANTENPTDNDFTTVKEGNLSNTTNVQEIVLDQPQQATHIRLVTYSVYINNSSNNVAAKRIRVYEEDPEAGVEYDTNKQKDYWDYEKQKGTLAQQTEDDRWHYQIKESGVWKDLPASAYNGTTWMTNQSQSDYYWAKLAKTEITSTFTRAEHQALAFSWKAPRKGYYKATLEAAMTNTNGSQLDFVIGHAKAGETNDGEILLAGLYGNGQTFTSKIAKAEAGDFIRIGAKKKDAWVQNFLPMVVEVTAKDYAEQYLTEVEGVENQGTYTESSKQVVATARTQLSEAVAASEPNMQEIETKIEALEQAIANLTEYVAVEQVTLNKETLPLTIGQTETLQATVNPDTATDQEVTWSSLNPDVATVDDTGLVTAKKVGNAIIEVYSTLHPEIKAQCTVVVTRDDKALEAAIAEAEDKIAEADFEVKYTKTSKDALRADLEMARDAKADTTMTPETVQEVVNSLKASIAGLELKAVVTISNNGNEEVKYCEIGEQVKVVAAQAPEGQKFSHWAVDGKPIAYGPIYTFTVYGNVNVASVYIDEQVEVVPEATVMCTASYDKSTQIIKFTAKRSVPVGCKVIKHGMILTGNSAWDALYKNNPDSFVLGAERIITKTGKTTGLLGNYSASVKATSPSIWYAKGYVTYEDKNGEQKTVYSDLVQYEVK